MARKPEIVPVETIGVGDVVRSTTMVNDVETTRKGRVANIRVLGVHRLAESEQGTEIVRYNVVNPRGVHCEMVERYNPLQPGLFEVEK